ncbi:TetR/AcrR family transcriptional regulator [Tropicimonas sp. S265A]|uniref:TetR/AcrR family transcriptional regulator n=1 Tax=Tropicimonas sp. S265A TaxID=3415134 RepID=UPI003C7AB956
MTDSAKVRTKRAYHHGDLRQQLLNATRQLVEEKGPDAFSVSEACRRAGVSTAAPYRHFADKTDMLAALIVDCMAEMTTRLIEAGAAHPFGTLEAIAAGGVEYVEFAEANPGVFRMMFAENYQRPEIEEAGHACYNSLLLQVAAYLGKDTVDEDVLRESFPLWTFVHGASFLRIDGKADFAKTQQSAAELVVEATRRLLPPRPTYRS